jgi:hypothetical protein
VDDDQRNDDRLQVNQLDESLIMQQMILSQNEIRLEISEQI